ncbi:MAG TPA: LLM class flavin-dependent oxidoreductase [Thermomicrobiaceae bacterium]|nr:LLM class flavin-dependent oxidoreductase [Thermomicrobiaceae bacterium]
MTTAAERRRPMKVGLFLPFAERQFGFGETARWADLLEMTRRAEEVGFDSVWVADHLLIRLGSHEQQGVWECWSIVSALAAATSRIEIGTLVLCTSFRNPALTAKMADTVDEISGGRLVLGLGAGYQENEFRAFGYPFDHRVSRFAEAIEVIHTLLREGRIDHAGRYYSARDGELRPRGPRPLGPPILVGGRGERVLELTARYADSWNAWLAFGRSQPDMIPPLRTAVDAACAKVGRDPATLARTAAVMVELPSRVARGGSRPERISGSPEEIAARLRAFRDEGISELQIWPNPNSVQGIEEFAPVLEILDQG